MTKRFITSNADNRIPMETQLLLWVMYDRTPEPRDYFHVFELTERNGLQIIRHFQEEPEWEETAAQHTDSAVTEKVYIIQDDDVVTMLLAEDY